MRHGAESGSVAPFHQQHVGLARGSRGSEDGRISGINLGNVSGRGLKRREPSGENAAFQKLRIRRDAHTGASRP